jgi:serine/threonine protein kinase
MADLSGRTLAGRYRVDELIGRGGMAEVYRVWDIQRSVALAMKMLREDLAEDRVFLRRFKREAQTLAKLQHPNIVRFYGLEQDGPLAFMLMEYVEGTSLRREIFDAQGGISLPRLLAIIRPVCAALHYAHQSGFVHCDIKPGNILIDKQDHVLVSDFGIARMTESATATMVGAGTPAYMSPEQARGENPTPQTDIYSLGIVIFEMLSGERPFTGEHARTGGTVSEKIRWKQLNQKPSLRKIIPSISPELEAVVMKCLEKDASRRYLSVLDLLNALTSVIPAEDTTTEVKRKSRSTGPRSPRPVRPVRLFLGIGIPLIALLLIAGGFLLSGRMIASADTRTSTPISVPTQTSTLASRPTSLPEPTSTPSPMPTPLGAGGGIGVRSNTRLYLVQPASSEAPLEILSLEASWHSSVDWSADGRQVAFTRTVIGKSDDIIVYDIANRVEKDITNNPDYYINPLWSPDSSTIFFYKSFGKWVEGTGWIDQINAYLAYPDGRQVIQIHSWNSVPMCFQWSPDGTYIAYADALDVWKMTADGKTARNITYVGGASCGIWSPDGTRLAFLGRLEPGSPYGLYKVVYDGSAKELVKEIGSFQKANPYLSSWSPDGKYIVIWLYADDTFAVIDINSGDMHEIFHSTSSWNNGITIWSPDSQWIAFIDDGYLYAVHPDGSDQMKLTDLSPVDDIYGWFPP